MAKGQITGKELIADDVLTRLASVDAELLKILATYNDLIKKAQQFNTPSGGNSVVTQRNSLDGQFNANQKEKLRLLKSLETQEARSAQASGKVSKAIAEQRFETNKLNRENRELAKLNLGDAYDKLAVNVSRAKRELKNLTITQGQNADATKRAQKEFDTLSGKIRKADAVAGDFQRNVGNYPKVITGAIGAIKQLIGVFGVIETVRIAFNFAKEAVELAKQAKGVEFAFKDLGQVGVETFNDIKKATRGALSDISIKRAINEFKNLGIQLETSGLAFEFLAVRAAQSGRSIDSLKEDLVTGLGRGSVRILDNLGLSMAELNVLTKEQGLSIQEAFGVIAQREISAAGNILDEAANSSEQFAASFENLKVNIGILLEGVAVLGFFVSGLEALNDVLLAQRENTERGGSAFKEYVIQLRAWTSAGREANKQLIQEGIERKKVTEDITNQAKAYVLLNGSIGPLREGEDIFTNFSLRGPLQDVIFFNKEIERLNQTINEQTSNEEVVKIRAAIAGLENQRDAILGVSKAKKKVIKVIDGTIAAYERDIAKQKEFITQTATTTKEIKDAEFAISQLQGQIDNLRDGQELIAKVKLEIDSAGLVAPDDIRSFQEAFTDGLKNLGFDFDGILSESQTFFDKLQEQQENNLKKFKQTQVEQKEFAAQTFGELFGTFAQYYRLDLRAFQDLIGGKKAIDIDYAAAVNSIANSILEGKLINYQIESERNRETLDAILNDSNASEKKKLQAQKEFDRAEQVLREKKAKAERESILFQISIDTAQAVTKALLNAYALLSNPLTAPLAPNAFAQAAIAGAFGAAQLAFVASRPLPQFFLGKKATDNFEGIGTWGERRKEVNVDSQGNIEISPNKTTPRHIMKSDIIVPSISQFDREIKNPNSDVFKRVSKRYKQDTVNRTFSIGNSKQDYKGIEKAVERAMLKYVDRPSVWNGTVKVEQPRRKYHG